MRPVFSLRSNIIELRLTVLLLLVSIFLVSTKEGSGQCVNPPTVTLSSISGNSCGTLAVTVSGNTFGGSATAVTITENGGGSVSPTSATRSPFSFTYTPASKDVGKTIIITVTTNNPAGSPCTAARATYSLTISAIPSAPVVGTITHPTCSLATGSVILSGLPSSGTWIINPGAITGTGTSTTISGLSAGTYNFTVTNSAGCISALSANVVIKAQPASPASPVQTIDCTQGLGHAVVTVTSPRGTGITYRLDAGAYQSGTSFSGVANGSHTITVRNSSLCTTTGPTFTVSCGCTDPPLVTLSSASGSTCGTAPVTVSNNTFGGIATGVTITENGSGTVSPATTSTNPFSFTYTPVAADAGNTVIITVTTNIPTGTQCVAAVTTYTLTVNRNPVAPTVGLVTQPTCSVATGSVVMSGLPSAGTWTLTRNPGGVLTTGTGISTTLTGLSPGTYTYTVTNSAGCVSGASLNVVITAPSSVPVLIITNPAPVCSPLRVDLTNPAVTVGSTPGLTYTYWTNNSATIEYTTPSSAAAGTYYIKGTNATGCFDIKPVIATISQSPTINAGTGGNECDLNFKLNAVPSIGTGTWTMTTGLGTASFSPDAHTPGATVTVSVYGAYVFTWTEINGTCSKSSAVTVNFYQQPVANAGTGGNYCGLDFNLNASLNVGIGTWAKVSGPGDVTFSPDANTPNSIVSVSTYGSYIFSWTGINGTCSNSTSISINFILQSPANGGTGGYECDKDFLLNASLTTGTGKWTKISGPGNAVFTPDDHQPDALVTVDQIGTYDFGWTVINSTCTSIDIVRVIFHGMPSLDAGKDTAVCKGANIQFHALGTGFFSWSPVALVSNPYISDPVATTYATTVFTVTLTDQFGCHNTDDIKVEVRENPSANAGPDQVLSGQSTTKMAAKFTHEWETGNWSLISGTGEISDSTYSETMISGLSPDINQFLWKVFNGVCPPSVDTINIIVNDFIIPTLITPNLDGKNDYLVLRGLTTHGKTELLIFDRRGAMVYKNTDYDNKWDGVDYNNKPLHDDTYFFVLKTEIGKSLSGYIVIRR
jgi:trimeric autotransporter adhesin